MPTMTRDSINMANAMWAEARNSRDNSLMANPSDTPALGGAPRDLERGDSMSDQSDDIFRELSSPVRPSVDTDSTALPPTARRQIFREATAAARDDIRNNPHVGSDYDDNCVRVETIIPAIMLSVGGYAGLCYYVNSKMCDVPDAPCTRAFIAGAVPIGVGFVITSATTMLLVGYQAWKCYNVGTQTQHYISNPDHLANRTGTGRGRDRGRAPAS